MKPKLKAEELVRKYSFYFHGIVENVNFDVVIHDDAKQCALIAVNEIIDSINWHPLEYPNKEIIFWNEVIEEIEKL